MKGNGFIILFVILGIVFFPLCVIFALAKSYM